LQRFRWERANVSEPERTLNLAILATERVLAASSSCRRTSE
jgi:hypothetical protein